MVDTLGNLLNQSEIVWSVTDSSDTSFVNNPVFTLSLLDHQSKRLIVVGSYQEFSKVVAHAEVTYTDKMELWKVSKNGRVYRPGFGDVVAVGDVPGESAITVLICTVRRDYPKDLIAEQDELWGHMLRHALWRRDVQNNLLALANEPGVFGMVVLRFSRSSGRVDVTLVGDKTYYFATNAFRAYTQYNYEISSTDKMSVGCVTVLARSALHVLDSDKEFIVCIMQLHGFRHLP